MWRDDAYLLDMLLAAHKVQRFSAGVTWRRFQRNELLQHAVMRLIQIIGEAARKVSPECRDAHPEIPWNNIVGMRHRLVQDDVHMDIALVWDVVQRDVPALIPLLEPLVPPEDSLEGEKE